jgi:type IV pilus assembly protein PilB
MASPNPQANTDRNFERFLIDHGFITKTVFDRLQQLKVQNSAGAHKPAKAGSAQTATVSDITPLLLSERLMDEEDLAKARAAFFNLPYVDLRKNQVPSEVLAMIPEESRNFYNVVPFEAQGSTLKVAITDPSNLQALEALEFLGQKQNLQIQLFLASSLSVDVAMGKRKNLTSVVGQALKDIQQKEVAEKKPVVIERTGGAKVIQDAPIIKIVDVILSNAIEASASDIHIEPSDTDVRIRYRIDGILHTSLMLPKHVHAAIISRIKILSNLKIDEQRLPQDGRFHFESETKSVDLRVSILPLIYGEKIVMRILDKTGSVPTLDQLGVRGKALDWVKENIQKTHGIFLITGPTGSGKSTTLYSILSMLNSTSVNIVTLEDPVEYFIEGVNQSQINPDIGLTFAAGLRSILRQDPNVIMVGEVRDSETAELAVHAALTGHLVFSTLHTNNAGGAIPRLIDMGIEPFLLMASINVVAGQRLVRKICPDCKKETEITKVLETAIKQDLKGIPKEAEIEVNTEDLHLYKGEGCERCGHTGYRGRMGIFEVLPITPKIQELFLTKGAIGTVYEAAARLGMITMKQDGVLKALKGDTTMDEVIRVTTE